MSDTLHLLTCPFLKKEIERVLKGEQFTDISLVKSAEDTPFSSEKLVTFSDDLKVLRFGCAAGIVNIRKILLEHHECMDLLIGKRLSQELQSQGKQILLPNMLSHLTHALEAGTPKENFAYLKT